MGVVKWIFRFARAAPVSQKNKSPAKPGF